MKRYLLLTVAMMAIFLALFGLAEWLGVPLLTDPGPWLSRGGWIAAALGFGLLVADVLLPVPSSLVMIAHGALFGVVGGTLLSLAGSLGAGLFGFALGRRGGPLLDRLVPMDERQRANALLERWGDLAIVVTRPVPILAETLAILAGASSMRWSRMTAATFAGSLPAALIYALAGATARSLDNVALVFGLVLVVTGGFWLVGKRLRRREILPAEPGDQRDEGQGPGR
jgi:uncharacterized membrane protein YdjX (TVP38/TMEM64 family)